MTGFIPAGGMGERLQPLTLKYPKPALLMGLHSKRLIDYSLNVIPNESNVVVSVGHLGNVLVDHLYKSAFEQSIKILRDSNMSNIGGSIAQHIKEIGKMFSDYVLILPSDHILEGLDVEKMLQDHINKNVNITGLVTKLKKYGDYLSVDQENVVRLHNQTSYSNMRNYSATGIYLFTTTFLLDSVHKKLKQGWQAENYDLTTDIVFPSIKSGKVSAYILDENCYWDDTGTLGRYYQNNLRLSSGENIVSSSALIEDGVKLDQVVVLDLAKLRTGVKLRRTIVAPDSEINEEPVGDDRQLIVLYNKGDKKYVEMEEN